MDKRNGASVAIKIAEGSDTGLKQEAGFLEELQRDVGTPQFMGLYKQDDYEVLVMERLGHSLQNLLKVCGDSFTLRTVLLIADQAICRLKGLHSRGIVHGDIKPSNMVLGQGKSGNRLYLIDFGLSSYKCERKILKDPKLADPELMHGSPLFASRSAHWLGGGSPFDDLESLAYVLVYLLKKLPWEDLDDNGDMLRQKFLPAEVVCEDLPTEFATLLNYAHCGKGNEEPDYKYLRKMFSNLYSRRGYLYTFSAFDWTRRTHELLEECGWTEPVDGADDDETQSSVDDEAQHSLPTTPSSTTEELYPSTPLTPSTSPP